MVHAFDFNNGQVSHMNRWAQTKRFEIEKKLGGSYFSGMNPLETDPRLLDFVLKDKEGVANMSIIYHSGRLLSRDGCELGALEGDYLIVRITFRLLSTFSLLI